jgi:hypothetical protein
MTENPGQLFRNDASQRERERILRNDTFQSRAQAEADEIQGRFAQEHKATVIGTGPVQYPMAAPNWSADPVGVEPPLGQDVNAQEPVGEAFEIANLTGATVRASDATPSHAGDAEAPELAASPASVEPPVISKPKPKPRPREDSDDH